MRIGSAMLDVLQACLHLRDQSFPSGGGFAILSLGADDDGDAAHDGRNATREAK